jgi:hypothetical protein
MDELNRRYRLYMARIEELNAKAPPADSPENSPE